MSKNLEATIDIDAAPGKVWAVVSDLRRMPEWSPQCRRMIVLGGVREGARTININKQGWLVWPTTSKIVKVDPDKAIAFRIVENRTTWSFTLEPTKTGTKLIQRRDVPAEGTTLLSRKGIQYGLGGDAEFDVRTTAGMNETLGKIKQAVEKG